MQKTKAKLPIEKFGIITISSSLNHYLLMNEEYKKEVDLIVDRYFHSDFGGDSENQRLCDQVVKASNGGILYGFYKLSNNKKIFIKTVGYGIKEEQMDLKTFLKADYNNTCIMFPSDD